MGNVETTPIAAATWNLTIVRGDTWTTDFSGLGDLTGYTISITIYGAAGIGGTPLLTLSTPASGITIGGTGNAHAYPVITPTQSAALPPGSWPWVWKFISPSPTTTRYIVGTLTVDDVG